jgi:myosin heavy subunit
MSTQERLPLLSGVKREPSSSQKNKAAKDVPDDYALCQEYTAYIVQLRGLLEETTGQPPAGVSNTEVERRIALIQSALAEVERRHAEVRWRMELRHNQRLLDTYARRIQAEAEAEQKRQSAEKQRRAQVEEMRTVQVAYYKDRNSRIDAKAQQCRTHNDKVQEETVERAGSNEERRARNLAKLAAERQRKQKELHDREQEKQAYARQVRERRAAQVAKEQEEKARQAEIHRQEMEVKLAAIRESKRSAWSAKKEASRAKSEVAWENGKAILETVRKDHNKLVEELEQRQKQQAERYADGKAEQEAYLRQRAQYRATRQERQQEALRKLIDQRLSRGTEIVKESEEKREKAKKARARQATQYLEAGKDLDEDILRHQQRAQQLQEQRYNESLSQNYRRWNHRAARIMEELQEKLLADDSHAAPPQQGGAANRDAPVAGAQNSADNCGRAISLPTPKDFTV